MALTLNQPAHSTALSRPFLLALAALTLVSAAARSILAIHVVALPKETQQLDHFAFSLILALGVRFDRLARHFSVPFEFDAFMFFAWLVVLPWYLYRTRGKVGLLYTAALYLLAVLPNLAAAVTSLIFKG